MNLTKFIPEKPFFTMLLVMVAILTSLVLPVEVVSQAQFQGVPQPPQRQPQQMDSEYAFRPNLTNPEFGECLQLERNWKTLWNSYYQAYYHAQRMHPSDSQYQQMAAYVNNLRYQLDAAWTNFSQKCVYFPRR